MGFIFFTSYSKNNRTKPLERFLALLLDQVFQRIEPAMDSREAVTFFAPSTIEVGDEWRGRLVDALRQSKVIVCFCSPHYLASKWCGRELGVFQQRRDAWLNQPGHEQKRARVIFPVLWVKTQGELPEALSRYQDDNDGLPRKYKDNGLLALVELRKERDTVKQVAIELSKAIASALKETSLPDLAAPLPIESLNSIFHEEAPAARYQIAAACLKGWDWKPFDGEDSMEQVIDGVAAGSQRGWSRIESAEQAAARLEAAGGRREAVILLCDIADLDSPAWQGLWSRLESPEVARHCAVLLVWKRPPSTPQEVQETEEKIRLRLPAFSVPPHSQNWFKIQSTTALAAALAEAEESVCLRLVQADDPLRVVRDDQRRAEAIQTGVPVDLRPQVTGPGGRA